MFKSFFKHNKGSTSLIYALCALPLFAAVGFGLDYSKAMAIKMRLQDLADAAVLTGVGHNASTDGEGMVFDEVHSKNLVKAYFEHGLLDPHLSENVSISPTYTVTKVEGKLTVILHYDAYVNNAFGGLFGLETMHLASESRALSAPPTYIDIIALIDNSGSMGIGASVADQTIMQNKGGCTFACHGQEAFYHGHGAKLRIDIVSDALTEMIDKIKDHADDNANEYYRISLYTYSNNLVELQAATTDLNTVKAKLNGMLLADRPGQGTNHTYSLGQFKALMPTGGTGATADDRRLFVMLFTDGISDDVFFPAGGGGWYPDPNYTVFAPMFLAGGERLQGLNKADCVGIKDKKATLLTLDLEYVVPNPTGDSRYITIRDNLKPNILANLRDCATSPTLAYVANDPEQIHKATNEMYNAIMERARLTK